MTLRIFSDNEQSIYQNLLASSPEACFMHDWSWGEWQHTIFSRTPIRLALYENDQPVLIGQGLLLDLPLGFSYLYFPYGPIPYSEISEKNYLDYLSNLSSLLKEKFSNSFFIRIEPKHRFSTTGTDWRHFKNVQPQSTLVLDLKKDKDTLLAEMHSKTRYNIKLAQRHEVWAEETKNEAEREQAIDLIVTTGKRQNYHGYNKEYYKKLLDFFAPGAGKNIIARVYVASFNKEILSSAIMLDYKSARTYLFGGSSDNNRQVMAPYLLHWQALQDAKNTGIEQCDFWGLETAAGKESGFVRFKMGFGGEVKHYGGAWDVPLKPVVYKGYRIIHQILSSIR